MIGYLITVAAGVFAIILVVRLVMDGRRNLPADAVGPHPNTSWRIYLGAISILAAGVPRIFPGAATSDWVWGLSAVMYVVGLVVLLSGKRREVPARESGG